MPFTPTSFLSSLTFNQEIADIMVDYKLLNFISGDMSIPINTYSKFFKAYNYNVTNEDGLGDVTIDDFNAKDIEIIEQKEHADNSYKKKTKIYDTIINENFITPAIFYAIFNDIVFNVIRPMIRKQLEVFIDIFESVLLANDAQKIEIGGTKDTIKDDLVLIRNNLRSLQVADPLYSITIGSRSLTIENILKENDTILFFNTEFISNYNIALESGVYNKDSLSLPKSNTMADFDIGKESKSYAKDNTKIPKLSSLTGLIMSKKLFIRLIHYQMNKLIKIPALWDLYMMIFKWKIFKLEGEYCIPIYKKASS